MELAAKLGPSAKIDGFDISPNQYPPEVWRPNNVHLYTQDIFKPFPEASLGQYDIVHVRFMLTLVNNKDAEPLLENLVTLLSMPFNQRIIAAGVFSV